MTSSTLGRPENPNAAAENIPPQTTKCETFRASWLLPSGGETPIDFEGLSEKTSLFPTRLFIKFFDFQAGGASSSFSLSTNEDTECRWWFQGWSPWRTCHLWNFCQAVTLRCFSALRIFRISSIHFRQISSHVKTIFDVGPIIFRFEFDFMKLHFDELCLFGLLLLPEDYLFLAILNVCVNRGLWDSLPLLRTSPDNM